MKVRSYLSIVIFIAGLLNLSYDSFATGNATKPGSEKTDLSSEVDVTKLNGLVVDEQTGESIAGAEIFINNESTGIYSDFDGNFKLEGIPVGNYDLKVEFISYQEEVINDLPLSSPEETLVIKL